MEGTVADLSGNRKGDGATVGLFMKFSELNTKQTFAHQDDLACYLFDNFDVFTAVANDETNDAWTRPQNGKPWRVFVYASAKIANGLCQAVSDGFFVGYEVVAVEVDGQAKKVWL